MTMMMIKKAKRKNTTLEKSQTTPTWYSKAKHENQKGNIIMTMMMIMKGAKAKIATLVFSSVVK